MFAFKSRARSPEGEPIRLAFAPKAGEVVRMQVTVSGSIKQAAGGREQTTAIDMTYRTAYRCDEVRPNGDCLLSVTLEDLGGASVLGQPGAAARIASDKTIRASLEMDRHGALKRMELEGGTSEARQNWRQTLGQPGGWVFLVYPDRGLRVGEALDWGGMFDPKHIGGMLGASEAGLVPQLQGEAVFARRTVIEGNAAAEFDLNLVASMSGESATPAGATTIRSGVRFTGIQRVAIGTGMPIGELDLNMEQRSAMDNAGRSVTFEGSIRMRAVMSRSAAIAAPGPEAAPSVPAGSR